MGKRNKIKGLRNVPVYLFMGQSNSSANGRIFNSIDPQLNVHGTWLANDYPSLLLPVQNVGISVGKTTGADYPLEFTFQAGVNNANNNEGQFNPQRHGQEVFFAHNILQKNGGVPCILVKYAEGGKALGTDGRDANSSYHPSFTGGVLDRFKNYWTNHFLPACAKRGINPVIQKVFWNQGEADSESLDNASNYDVNHNLLSDNLAAFWGYNPDWIVTQLHSQTGRTFLLELTAAMQRLDKNSLSATSRIGKETVSVDSIGEWANLSYDNVHGESKYHNDLAQIYLDTITQGQLV